MGEGQSSTSYNITLRKIRKALYWRTGEGPPLVLAHGTSADHTRWDPILHTKIGTSLP